MRRFFLAALSLISFVCFAYLLLLPRSRYEWMADMDPQVSVAAMEDASGNAAVVAALAVGGIWLCQALFAWQSKSTRHSMLALTISALAGFVWYFRFG